MSDLATKEDKTPPFFTDWDALFQQCGIRSGMCISFHHHLRYGDCVVEQVLTELNKRNIREVVLCVSSVMGKASIAVCEAIKLGVVVKLETTGAKEPLSHLITEGALSSPVVFRTHGGRARALKTKEIKLDIAFIAASCVDEDGNCNGVDGKTPFGSLGYALDDARYADKVVIITDYISPLKLDYISIKGQCVDSIMVVDSIGDNALISEGSLRGSSSPIQKIIASQTAKLLSTLGVIKHDFSFQAGSGVISMLVTQMVADIMRDKKIIGHFASGGITRELILLLDEGLFNKLYDVQSFDLEAAASLQRNFNHIEMSAAMYADPTFDGNIASKLDVMILSATEIDCNFNLNSLTGTHSHIIGALGGAPDTAQGAALTIAVLPSMRGRIPTIHERVRTICTPGEHVDILVTERGIAINPLRADLMDLISSSKMKNDVVDITTLMKRIHSLTGTPNYVKRRDRVVAIVEYPSGGVLDTIHAL